MYMKSEKLTTKIAAVMLSISVMIGMFTAAPVRAAENQNAADQMGGAVRTEQTVQTDAQADQTQAAEADEQAATADEQADQQIQAQQEEPAVQSDAQAEVRTTETEKVQTPAAKSVSKKKASKKKSKAVEIEAPDEVDNVKAVSKGRGRIVITWSRVKDADGYYIYRAVKQNGKYKKVAKIRGEKSTKYSHVYKKLRKNKKYFFKVYAYKKVNGETLVSESADNDGAKNTLSYKQKYTMKATAYSGGGLCANGKRCKVGRVAVDPDVVPLGTWLYVKGYGFCQACDTGGAIQGKRIDLYYNSESQCNSYGVRYTQVYVLRK